MLLREVTGDNLKEKERLIEVTNRGEKTQMTRAEVDKLKEREDIRVHEENNKAIILNKLRG